MGPGAAVRDAGRQAGRRGSAAESGGDVGRRGKVALGPDYNIFVVGTAPPVATPPAFLRYRPFPYLRPFDLAPHGG